MPTGDELNAVKDSKSNRNRLFYPVIWEMLNPKQETLKPQTFCIQMRYQSESAIRASEKQMLLEKFHEARVILTNQLLGKAPKATP